MCPCLVFVHRVHTRAEKRILLVPGTTVEYLVLYLAPSLPSVCSERQAAVKMIFYSRTIDLLVASRHSN